MAEEPLRRSVATPVTPRTVGMKRVVRMLPILPLRPSPSGGAGRIASVRPVPPEVLVLTGIGTVQFGAAFANKLFDEAGPAGVVLLRLLLSAVILLAVARPTLR